MALDIAFGDLLSIGGVAYPVRGIARWTMTPGAGFLAMMTVTNASTLRAPAISGGKRGAAVTNLTNLQCTPLLPLEGDLSARQGLSAPVQLFETFIADDDAGQIVHVTVEDVSPLA